jgi:hypothetical protein
VARFVVRWFVAIAAIACVLVVANDELPGAATADGAVR